MRFLSAVFASPTRVVAALAAVLAVAIVASLTWWPTRERPGPPEESPPARQTPAKTAAGEPGLRAGAPGPAPETRARPRADVASAPARPFLAGATAGRPRVTVRSILVGTDRRLALVNGRIVGPGDRVGTAVVAEIHPRLVVLRDASGRRIPLQLAAPAPGAELR